jgi:hypothetical protein
VLEEIFGRNSQKLYPLCGSCHKKLHFILRPFEKAILLFSDIKSQEGEIVRKKMKEEALTIIGSDGGKDDADAERVITKLAKKGLGREESIQLLKDMRKDGTINFVMWDEPRASQENVLLINKIIYDYDSVLKAKKRLRAS